MNDSNNNIFDNNNVTSTPQPNSMTGTNSTPETNNLINNVNPVPVDANSVFGINSISNPTQTETYQANQNPAFIQPQNNFNTQMNNAVPNGNSNSMSVNSVSNNNINIQPSMQSQNSSNTQMNSTIPNGNNNPMPVNSVSNNNVSTQQNTVLNQIDDELLIAFIGNNYKKITTSPFNFSGFFFTTLYMFYRKMFGYALIVFLLNLVVLNVINNPIITIAFNVIVGLLVNKIYLSYAKKKITIIKQSNQQKSTEELKAICVSKGGTSVGKIFIGLFIEIFIGFIVLGVMMIIGIGGAIEEFFNFNNWNIIVNDESVTGNNSSKKDGTLVEDVIIDGYSCFNSKCNVSITDSTENTTDYVLGINNSELIDVLSDYADYIKLNIYYTNKENKKTIVGYEIYLKSNNKDISSVKTENELRDEIGLYSAGTYTALFTLSKVGVPGVGFNDNTSYTYISYTLVDSKNMEYEMKYIDDDGALELIEGNEYTVTFEVVEGVFGYEFTIKSIK